MFLRNVDSGNERLFILAEPRSGSSWLMETLNSHPEICLLGELLNTVQYPDIKRFSGDGSKDFSEWFAYLEKKLGAVPGRKIRYGGCKVLLNQMTLIGEDFVDRFLDRYRNASLIFLTRGNLVAEHISLRLAHRYDVWHVSHENQIVLKKIQLIPSVLVADMEKSLCRREKVSQAIGRRNMRCHSFSYEKLFGAGTGALPGIFTFLGLEERETAFSPELKGNPFRPNEVIENYEEVRAYLERYPDFLQMLMEA